MLFPCFSFCGREVASYRCYSNFYLVALVRAGYEDDKVVDSGYSIPSLADGVDRDIHFLTFLDGCRSPVSVLSAVVTTIIPSAATAAASTTAVASSSAAPAIPSSSA